MAGASATLPPITVPEPFSIIIFGATGDLASRKIFPSLNGLCENGYLPSDFVLIGNGRRPKEDNAFRADVKKAIDKADGSGENKFLPHVYYQPGDLTKADDMRKLGDRLKKLEAEHKLPGNRLFYLATDPEFFGPAVENLAAAGLLNMEIEKPWVRVVIEKPFGEDLNSATQLDHHLK